MTCFVIWCRVLSLAFLAGVFATGEKQQCEAHSYRRISLFNDQIAKDPPIWERQEFFTTQCAKMCSQDEHCMSFFHNAFTGSCQAHALSYTNPSRVTHNDGFQYFRFYPEGFRLSNCAEIGAYYNYGSSHNGIHTISHPQGPFQVYCSFPQSSNYQSWTVIQFRYDGSERFDRTWDEYEKGFGDLNKEFWLGNEKIRRLTDEGTSSLLVQMWDSNRTKWKAYFQNFSIGNSSMNYTLRSTWFSGSAGDGLRCLQGKPFSVCDADTDANSSRCADLRGGGWWFGSCHDVNLNGLYSTAGGNLSWMSHHTLMKTQMRLSPYI